MPFKLFFFSLSESWPLISILWRERQIGATMQWIRLRDKSVLKRVALAGPQHNECPWIERLAGHHSSLHNHPISHNSLSLFSSSYDKQTNQQNANKYRDTPQIGWEKQTQSYFTGFSAGSRSTRPSRNTFAFEMPIDKHLVSVSDEFNWILASDIDTLSICQTQPIFTNTEAAMLSSC